MIVNHLPRIHPADVDAVTHKGDACLADFGGYGACVRPKGHADGHRDALGYGWETTAPAAPVQTPADRDDARVWAGFARQATARTLRAWLADGDNRPGRIAAINAEIARRAARQVKITICPDGRHVRAGRHIHDGSTCSHV